MEVIHSLVCGGINGSIMEGCDEQPFGMCGSAAIFMLSPFVDFESCLTYPDLLKKSLDHCVRLSACQTVTLLYPSKASRPPARPAKPVCPPGQTRLQSLVQNRIGANLRICIRTIIPCIEVMSRANQPLLLCMSSHHTKREERLWSLNTMIRSGHNKTRYDEKAMTMIN